MENAGITPVMDINRGYGYGDGFGFGGSGLWLFAILALMWGGNGFFGGNGGLGYRPATAEDVNSGFNFADLQDQNRDILNAITSGTAQAVAATSQAKYDNINVIKDAQNALQMQLGEIKTTEANIMAHQQECCCAINRNIDSLKYDNLVNTQKILDTLQGNKIEALRDKIDKLELANAVAGVVRYPTSTSYSAGFNPFCSCGVANGNI